MSGPITLHDWVVELVCEDGDDIVDVSQWTMAADALRFTAANPPPPGHHYDVVLVRDRFTEDWDLIERQWAYVVDGRLPEKFDRGTKVPVRLAREWAKANKGAA